MDINVFQTEGSEYYIKISKQKKFFSQSKFGQYICTIEFLNNIYQSILSINCTELELYLLIQKLSELETNIAMGSSNYEMSTSVYFQSTGDFNSYFWFFTTTNIENYPEYPTDEDIMCSLFVYSLYLDKKSLRLYLPMSYSFIDVLIYNIYIILEDLPYLNDMNNDMVQKFIKGEL